MEDARVCAVHDQGRQSAADHLRCKNQAIDARPYLAIPFYVEVDVAGQYPIGATLGPGKRVFESLIFTCSLQRLGWMAMMRGDATTTAGTTAAQQRRRRAPAVATTSCTTTTCRCRRSRCRRRRCARHGAGFLGGVVKWEFVGDGTRDAPFNARAPEYLAFWQAHRDNSQRQQPLPSPTSSCRRAPPPRHASDGMPKSSSTPSRRGRRRPAPGHVRLRRAVPRQHTRAALFQAGVDDVTIRSPTRRAASADARSRRSDARTARASTARSCCGSSSSPGSSRSHRRRSPASRRRRAPSTCGSSTTSSRRQLWINARWILVCTIRRSARYPTTTTGRVARAPRAPRPTST